MPDRLDRMDMDLAELLEDLARPQTAAESEYTKQLIQVKLAVMQQDTARDSLAWAKWTAIGTIVAAAIAVVAFLVSVL